MSIYAPRSTEVFAVDLKAVPTSSTTEATSFFSLPRELRDLIYHYLFKDVYTQMRVNAHLRNLRLDHPDGDQSLPARQLKAMQASRRLWEEGSRVLYGENLFRLHIASEEFNTTLLERRITDLMQDIEIDLHPGKAGKAVAAPETLRVLQLFGTPQIMRRSCLVKLPACEVKLMSNDIVEALKKMTGFKTLIIEDDLPVIARLQSPVFPRHRPSSFWISRLLVFLRTNLTPVMGRGTLTDDNNRYFRRLTFKPQDHKKSKTGGIQVL